MIKNKRESECDTGRILPQQLLPTSILRFFNTFHFRCDLVLQYYPFKCGIVIHVLGLAQQFGALYSFCGLGPLQKEIGCLRLFTHQRTM